LALFEPLHLLRRRLRRLSNEFRRRRARGQQRAYCGAFIAVTGSCGKTTTTLLIERMLLATGATGRAGRNKNVGRYLVRELAKLRRPVDFVVQEVGIKGPGSIVQLTDYVDVDIAVVTSVGTDHASAFDVPKSQRIEAVAMEKGRLVEAVPASGLACLNADDHRVAAMAARTDGRVITYGRATHADVRATNVEGRWPQRLSFDLHLQGLVRRVTTRFVGTIMLPNVLAALAVVHGMGRDLDRAIAALANIEPEPLHMNVAAGASGRSYVLDTFKASLWSTEVLAADLANIGGSGTVFVLGEMSDLGSGLSSRYARVARIASPLVDRIILTDVAASAAAKVQIDGLPNVLIAPSITEAAELVKELPQRLVILKSKSGTGLEKLQAMVEGNS
jgi:UDP-N-acetylmuramoyl-tripeptide--D-alanyl-D-alanine ligase